MPLVLRFCSVLQWSFSRGVFPYSDLQSPKGVIGTLSFKALMLPECLVQSRHSGSYLFNDRFVADTHKYLPPNSITLLYFRHMSREHWLSKNVRKLSKSLRNQRFLRSENVTCTSWDGQSVNLSQTFLSYFGQDQMKYKIMKWKKL